jgi:hypothetical protein
MSPFLVAAVLVVALPVLWWCSSGERLAMCDGDLVVTRYWLFGERIVCRLDGGAGYWWLKHADGSTEPYAWEHAPAVLKLTPEVTPRR